MSPLRLLRRLPVIAAAVLTGMLVAGPTVGLLVGTAAAAVPAVSEVGAALERSPVYVDPQAGSRRVDAARVGPVLPRDTYLAVLPAAAVPAGAQPDELPALLSQQVGRGGTFIVLLGGRLYGASTTLPGELGADLAAAQSALLPGGGDATGTLISLMRSLSGSGDLQDAVGPSHAGGPVGAGVLLSIGIGAVAGALALWWWLRRRPSPQSPQRPRPGPRDLVEIDHAGRIIRRTPAAEREL